MLTNRWKWRDVYDIVFPWKEKRRASLANHDISHKKKTTPENNANKSRKHVITEYMKKVIINVLDKLMCGEPIH